MATKGPWKAAIVTMLMPRLIPNPPEEDRQEDQDVVISNGRLQMTKLEVLPHPSLEDLEGRAQAL
jgi:hypothetical protein